MNPIEFKEQNKVYAKNQTQYKPLPVYEDNGDYGSCIHCWELSFIERIKILFTGKLWVYVLNFGHPLHPIKLMVNNPFKDNQ